MGRDRVVRTRRRVRSQWTANEYAPTRLSIYRDAIRPRVMLFHTSDAVQMGTGLYFSENWSRSLPGPLTWTLASPTVLNYGTAVFTLE